MNLSTKTIRMETVFFSSEWFLSIILDYLSMRDIVILDSAICNKSNRAVLLKCIAKDIGSVSSKLQSCLTNDKTISWCFKRNVQFKHLDIKYNLRQYSITTSGAKLFSKCCINLTEFQLTADKNEPSLHEILNELGQRCSKLIRIKIYSSFVTDEDITPFMSNNHALEDIELDNCIVLTDTSLLAMAANCHGLKTVINGEHNGIKYVPQNREIIGRING